MVKELQSTVNKINDFLQKSLWFDFEIMSYSGNDLKIMASIDISDEHNIEIFFYDVFFISLPMEWKTDTSEPPMSVVTGEESYPLIKQFQLEEGYTIFKFTPEYLPEDSGCYIAARSIDFAIMKDFDAFT